MIRYSLILIIILSSSTLVLAQEEEHEEVIVANDTWGKEFFTFPLRFAGDIDFKGLEDARFPKGWGDVDSPEFWTYAFAWNISADAPLTTVDMEINLQYYFNGLLTIDSTNAVFVQGPDLGSNFSYTGKINTVDTRFTKKPMTLHVKAKQYYCKQSNKTFMLFKFSPKGFEHNAWKKLQEVDLREDLCKK